MTQKEYANYLTGLFREYIKVNGDTTDLEKYGKQHGRTKEQIKDDITKVSNLFCACEIFINKAVRNEYTNYECSNQ